MSARILSTSVLVMAAVASVAVGDDGVLSALSQGEIRVVRITLNPWGPHLGFAADLSGDDRRLAPLLEVLSEGEPAASHKCANRGAIRFELSDGRRIAVGLLPSHEKGFYEFRLYDDGRLEGVYRVRRESLLGVLGNLGVPVDDPAFSG